jgi:PAS domain-containing protein
MWALRVLTGPQAGQLFPLKNGRNLIGRAPNCDIKLVSPGVSKEHSEITINNDRIVVTDLKSSNGTFVNGVKVQTGMMRLGDKVGVHDIIVDVVPAPEVRVTQTRTNNVPMTMQGQVPDSMTYPSYGGAAGQAIPMPQAQGQAMGGPAAAPAPAYHQGGIKLLIEKAQTYIEKVALPGVYKLPEFLEFKMVLLGFVVLFIFCTTLLAMIPMVAISRASIISESKRRAASIARTVATLNQAALLQNSYSSLNTNSAESEDGVKQVLIVQQSDGMILAPATRAGTTPDLPFVHVARREMRPQAVEVDSSTIGASFPIGLFDPSTGEQSVKAHAIVLYDIGSLAFDDGRVISLFMQTLIIACLAGLLIYYFMYKLIEYPINSLNSQLDIAMREKKDSTEVAFIFPAFQALVGNVNSLLSRYIHGEAESGSGGQFVNKEGEAENLAQIVGFPCIMVSRDGRIIAFNPAFAQIAHIEPAQYQGKPLQSIPDGALFQNINELMSRSKDNTRVIQTDQLEFSGHPCILSCQAMSSSSGEVDYYVVTISPAEGSS